MYYNKLQRSLQGENYYLEHFIIKEGRRPLTQEERGNKEGTIAYRELKMILGDTLSHEVIFTESPLALQPLVVDIKVTEHQTKGPMSKEADKIVLSSVT